MAVWSNRRHVEHDGSGRGSTCVILRSEATKNLVVAGESRETDGFFASDGGAQNDSLAATCERQRRRTPRPEGAVGSRLASILLLLVLPLVALCQGADNLDLEQGAAGWTLMSPGATVSRKGAAQGARCLSLIRADADVWAISPVLPAPEPGTPFALSVSMRRTSGEGDLALSLVDGDAVGEIAPFWQGTLGRNRGWRKLTVHMVCGIAAPRLAVGAVGAPCSWLVDAVRLAPVRVPPVRMKADKDRVPEYCAPTVDGWAPEGDMDLLSKTIMGEQSFHIRPGFLDLNPPTEITVLRGERTGMLLDVLPRGNMDLDLQVGIHGPAGWRNECWTMPVPSSDPMTVSIPVQVMTAGTFNARVDFTSSEDTKQMPLTVHSQRHYPAFGVNWSGPEELPSDLSAFRAMPAQFHHATISPGSPTDWLGRLCAAGADLGVTVRGDVESALETLASLPGDILRRTYLLGCEAPDLSLQEARRFYEGAKGLRPDAVILGQPFALVNTPEGVASSQLAEAIQSGVARWAHVARLRLPQAPRTAVLREAVDGKALRDPLPALQFEDQQWSTVELRAMLQAQGAQLPFYAEYRGKTAGDASLDAFVMSRVIVQVLAMGANAFLMEGRAQAEDDIALLRPDGSPNEPVMRVFGEMSRELASARPLSPPEGTELAAYEPGHAITYRPFIRGDEGIVALWNNTPVRQDIALDVRSRPIQVRVLRISYPGELCVREFDGAFEWDALARKWNQPAVYLRVEPLQTVIVSLKLRGAHNAWLREVGPQPPKTAGPDPRSIKSFEEHGGRDM